MIDSRIRDEYFSWMCDKVCGERFSDAISYRRLLAYLHDSEFICVLGMDRNRAEDGISLRRHFALELGYEPYITDYLDGPCSILEMMVALAIHIEKDLMDDPRIGDRTAQWFWGMIRSLGLNGMYDVAFNENLVEDVIIHFLNREYEPDGHGGLFTVRNCYTDMRDLEINIQRNLYLNTLI